MWARPSRAALYKACQVPESESGTHAGQSRRPAARAIRVVFLHRGPRAFGVTGSGCWEGDGDRRRRTVKMATPVRQKILRPFCRIAVVCSLHPGSTRIEQR